jgi:hypothetical protein
VNIRLNILSTLTFAKLFSSLLHSNAGMASPTREFVIQTKSAIGTTDWRVPSRKEELPYVNLLKEYNEYILKITWGSTNIGAMHTVKLDEEGDRIAPRRMTWKQARELENRMIVLALADPAISDQEWFVAVYSHSELTTSLLVQVSRLNGSAIRISELTK